MTLKELHRIRDIGEVFDTLPKATSKDEAIHILRMNKTRSLVKLLSMIYNTRNPFVITERPDYKEINRVYGLGFSNLKNATQQLKLFTKDFDGSVPYERRQRMLSDICSALVKPEAEYLLDIVTNQFTINNLTKEIAIEAFPEIKSLI